MSDVYVLLRDLPDGSKPGDTYIKINDGSGKYYNQRIYSESTVIDEGQRWDSWQVENNPTFFQLKKEPEFVWDDIMVQEFFKYCYHVVKNGEHNPVTLIKQFKASKQQTVKEERVKVDVYKDFYSSLKHHVSDKGFYYHLNVNVYNAEVPDEKVPLVKQAIEEVLNKK